MAQPDQIEDGQLTGLVPLTELHRTDLISTRTLNALQRVGFLYVDEIAAFIRDRGGLSLKANVPGMGWFILDDLETLLAEHILQRYIVRLLHDVTTSNGKVFPAGTILHNVTISPDHRYNLERRGMWRAEEATDKDTTVIFLPLFGDEIEFLSDDTTRFVDDDPTTE